MSATGLWLTGVLTLLTLHEMHPTDPVVTLAWRIFWLVVMPLITVLSARMANKARREGL